MKRDEFEDYDTDDYEDNEKINPWVTAGVFVGMIILVAVFCGILWSVTHKDKQPEWSANTTESIQDIPAEESIWSEELISEDDVEESLPEVESIEKEAENETVEESHSNDVVGELPENVTDDFQNSSFATDGQDMVFAKIADTVTAKDVTNLRSEPSAADGETIVAQLQNGETLSRTGINEDTGWSRLDYNGQTVYAVSGYLTTDLSYETPVEQGNPNRITTQDGRVIVFEDCDDYVRPKHYVNLRTEPSTSQGESTIKCQITHADIVHRTGYSEDSGWSRVEFYGEVLYVVSSYMYSAE